MDAVDDAFVFDFPESESDTSAEKTNKNATNEKSKGPAAVEPLTVDTDS